MFFYWPEAIHVTFHFLTYWLAKSNFCAIIYNYCTWTRSIWGFMEQSTTILNEAKPSTFRVHYLFPYIVILLLTVYCYWPDIVTDHILLITVYCDRSYIVADRILFVNIVTDHILYLTVYCYWPYIVIDHILSLTVYYYWSYIRGFIFL